MDSELDWNTLEEKTQTKRTRYKFADVSHLMQRVAFDQYKPLSGAESLWELREEGGEKFLYAVYDEPTDLTSISSDEKTATAGWAATSDRDGKNISLSFKNIPLVRFAAAEHGFTPEEAEDFAKFLSSKTRDGSFVAKLAKTLPEEKRVVLASLLDGSKT